MDCKELWASTINHMGALAHTTQSTAWLQVRAYSLVGCMPTMLKAFNSIIHATKQNYGVHGSNPALEEAVSRGSPVEGPHSEILC